MRQRRVPSWPLTALAIAGWLAHAGASADPPLEPWISSESLASPPPSSEISEPGTYLERLDAARLPWRRLFERDGAFVPESALASTSGVSPERTPSTHSIPAAPAAPAAPSGATASSDARAVVRGIDRSASKVKLKHGPIPKLDMPGMTMVFRVRDPAILDQVREGQEVGVTVELDGTTFYVTGFQP